MDKGGGGKDPYPQNLDNLPFFFFEPFPNINKGMLSVVNGTGRSRPVAAQNNVGHCWPWPARSSAATAKKKFNLVKKFFSRS